MAKLASFALAGVSFAAGRWLLDGPASGFLRDLINAPVFAYCGLEWYLCSGGLLVGLLFGIAAALAVNWVVAKFRGAMIRIEDQSGFYQRHKEKKSVRFGFWLLFGPRHQWDTYKKLLGRRFGNPVRIAGVIVAALLLGAAWFGLGKLAAPELRQSLQGGLQALNGATVDLGALELDVGANRIALRDLALADAEALERDLFRAAHLEGDLSGADLLARRLKIDRLVVREARHGAVRATPGERVGPPLPPSPPPDGTGADAELRTLDQWLAEAEKWEQRLKQAREWLEKVRRPATAEDRETLRQRLEREAREKGYGEVAASHLIDQSPAVQIGEILVEGIASDALGAAIDLRIENFSSNPALVDGAPRLTLTTRDGRYAFDVGLGAEARSRGESFIDVRIASLPTATLTAPIEARTGAKTLEGGTLDAGFKLAWGPGGVAVFDTPLAVKVKDSTLHLGQLGATAVKELAIPLLVRGPLDRPQVKVDLDRLADSLLAGGFAEFGQKVKDEAVRRANAVKEAASAEADRLGAAARAKGEALADQAKETTEAAAADATGQVKDAANRALEGALQGAGKEALSGAKDGLKDGLKGSGKEALDGLTGGGKDAAKELGGDAKESGKSVGDEAKKALDGLGGLNPFGKKDGDKEPKKGDGKKGDAKKGDGKKRDDKKNDNEKKNDSEKKDGAKEQDG
ncbi:MAG: hypothetical protein FJ293_06535 [Planctomycetes bacterium]|nr:hypothetical protein [Planctomycetota bacterium]